MDKWKLGVRQQLALVVFLSILFAALAISATIYFFNKERAFRDYVRQSEEMAQASAFAFSQAMAADDDILLDALVHELQSRKHLNITEIYAVRSGGRIAAHSRPEEYGKVYKIPELLLQKNAPRLSETLAIGSEFSVVTMLQSNGNSIGALVVKFSTAHIQKRALTEMFWVIGVMVFVLLISGFVVLVWGKMMIARLEVIKERSLAIGRGEWGEPMKVTGADEIAMLAGAFNQMRSDIKELRERDIKSAETITGLNNDLMLQLATVRGLKEQLAEENAALREELRSLHNPGELIGANGSLRQITDQARQLASLPVTILLTGESGTGKELLARYLHEAGNRSKKPFITVNCAALPATLFESELFGHEKGAFTGAVAQKKGKFEIADGGTLLLDEIGEIPLEAQAKLLRVLQLGEVCRIGGDKPLQIDVRVVAATNRNLQEEVRQKRFREDLYYRLKVVELRSPPLRERLDDLPTLVQYFIEQYSKKLRREVIGISPTALERLARHRWPGNIRELENMTARAVALASSKVLGPDDFSFHEDEQKNVIVRSFSGQGTEFEKLLQLFGVTEKELADNGWDRLLERCESICLEAMIAKSRNQKEAAEALGLTQTKLHRLIRKYGISKDMV